MTLQYELEEYETIKNDGFAYELSENTVNMVNKLAEQVGAPTYNKTPVFENKEYKKRKTNGNLTGEDWDAFRNFKATEISSSTGINKYFDNIRFSLNKMTENTYDSVRNEIINLLKNMMEEKYDDQIEFVATCMC